MRNCQRSIDLQWFVVSMALAVFSVFLLFKIHGYFDFSANFGVRKITASKESHNLLMLIDGDPLSTWGVSWDTPPYRQGDQILIEFRKARALSRIEITNTFDESIRNINIYVSLDGNDFSLCDYITECSDSTVQYSLSSPPPMIAFLRLEYNEESPGVWPISEVYLYD